MRLCVWQDNTVMISSEYINRGSRLEHILSWPPGIAMLPFWEGWNWDHEEDDRRIDLQRPSRMYVHKTRKDSFTLVPPTTDRQARLISVLLSPGLWPGLQRPVCSALSEKKAENICYPDGDVLNYNCVLNNLFKSNQHVVLWMHGSLYNFSSKGKPT